jgi:GH15 family glucan-1,4-alpha-glucosidase
MRDGCLFQKSDEFRPKGLIPNFIGRDDFDNAGLANGRILVTMQQYDEKAGRNIDRISQLLYPWYDLQCNMLGPQGCYLIVKDLKENKWYDPYNEKAEGRKPLWDLEIGIDGTKYVNGAGAYEVISHKGTIVTRTTTWVVPDYDSVVRKIELSSYVFHGRTFELFSVVSMQGEVTLKDSETIVSKVQHAGGVYFLAVTMTGLQEIQKLELPSDSQKFAFKSQVTVDRSEDNSSYYMILGVGATEEKALENLRKTKQVEDCQLSKTMEWWGKWHARGKTIKTSDSWIDYRYRLAKTILKMSLQEDGLGTLLGFKDYQGGVWIRDNTWTASVLAFAGYLEESKKNLDMLIKTIKKRPDGNYFFSYHCRTKEPMEHTYENDSPGLLIFGLNSYFQASGDIEFIKKHYSTIESVCTWMCNNTDKTGLIIPCAGIWEEFGTFQDEKWGKYRQGGYEHHTWVSGVDAFGLLKASQFAKQLGNKEQAQKWRKAGEQLIEAIKKRCVKDGILCRSLESDLMDASVIALFTWLPIISVYDDLAKNTIKAAEERLVDPFLGGVWRHEDWIVDYGDLQPWPGTTLWLGEAFLAAGQVEKAWEYFDWTLANTTPCGMSPEVILNKSRTRCVGLPSYSEGGFLVAMLRHQHGGRILKPSKLEVFDIKG